MDIKLDKKFIGQTIQNARRSLGLNQAELAERIDISEKHLSKIETGKNYPALNTFLKILKELNLTPGNFMFINALETCSDKMFLQKIINTLSKKQLTVCADVV